MLLCYIWYNDQWKTALRVSVGNKYAHYVVNGGTGIRKIRQDKSTKIVVQSDKDDAIKRAKTAYIEQGKVFGITKAAESALADLEASIAEAKDAKS